MFQIDDKIITYSELFDKGDTDKIENFYRAALSGKTLLEEREPNPLEWRPPNGATVR